mmetsp:Transcript_7948/g.25272  ORF Transcript_7948/g.25272 Transcript_7948/m.25272 type:complete len:661 (+) Transcript_7948:1-1983(+)
MGLAVGHGLVDDLEDGDETGPLPGNEGTGPMLAQMDARSPSTKMSHKAAVEEANECLDIQPDCGQLHDTFAELWGEMMDVVDETKANAAKDDLVYKTMVESLNGQWTALTGQKSVAQATLAEVTSSNSLQQQQQATKMGELKHIEEWISSNKKSCREVINYILFDQMSGAVKVRNELLVVNVPSIKLEDITDCKVTQWASGRCSVDCDDSLKGGIQRLHRAIITKSNIYGFQCPKMALDVPCNQVKCPQDCKLSQWTPFSKCSKDCGGGLRMRTRQVDHKARYGGTPCDTTQESQPCNTGSCDRDCVLGDWSGFSSCSKACGSGKKERQRPIVLPVRGKGVCPTAESRSRFEEATCNAHPCVGDEVCVAPVDIVLAIDGSGSLTAKGFEVLKTFAAKVVERYRPEAYGSDAVRIGVVQYGNGEISTHQNRLVVSDAKVIAPLSADFEAIAEKLKAMEWQKGFTNMAQAGLKAQVLLNSFGRKGLPQVVVFITDGRPTFRLTAAIVMKDLRRSATVQVLHVMNFPSEATKRILMGYCNKPTGYRHIPGKKALEGFWDYWVTSAVSQSCPAAESPSMMEKEAKQRGYRKIRIDHSCKEARLSSKQDNIKKCWEFVADEEGVQSFAFGHGQCSVCKQGFTRKVGYNVYAPSSRPEEEEEEEEE